MSDVVVLRELQSADALVLRDPAPDAIFMPTGQRGEKGDPGGNVMAIGLFSDAASLSIPVGTDAVRTSGHSSVGVGIADYVADATVDAAYVAAHPLSSFVSTNGRGFRLRVNGPALDLDVLGASSDGTGDNVAAWNEAKALFPDGGLVRLSGGGSIYKFSQLVIPTGMRLRGPGRGDTDNYQAKILITGDGGGAADRGVNGGVTMFGLLSELSGVAVSYDNPALQCLVNMSASGSTAIGRNVLEDFELTMEDSITAATSNAVALFLGNLIGTFPKNGRIRSAVGFKQNCQIRGFFNGCHIEEIAFGPHADDFGNSVVWGRLPQIDIDCSTQASSISKCTFEGGPNGIRARGQGSISCRDNYMADTLAAKGFWIPGLAIAQGDVVYPSATTTGSITAGTATLTLTSVASAYVGQKLTVIGAGAAGANLTARISSIAGSVATLDANAGTTVAGAGVYWGNYAGAAAVALTAGTTGAAMPAWPTLDNGGTVADNTVTWSDYGSCAWINGSTVSGGSTGKDTLVVDGGLISNNVCGVLSRRNGGQPKSVFVVGVDFADNEHAAQFSGVEGVTITGCTLDGYGNTGFGLRADSGASRNCFVAGNSVINGGGADVVVGTNSTNVGGMVHGNLVLTGIGAARFNQVKPSAGAATGFLNVPNAYQVAGVQVVSSRSTGWTVDTGTAKKTANATYTVGAAMSVGAAYSQTEVVALRDRIVALEGAMRDATQTIKALKDAGIAHGLIGP